ncbi:MAG: hypothetical protein Q9210_002587 [Variospora velana]
MSTRIDTNGDILDTFFSATNDPVVWCSTVIQMEAVFMPSVNIMQRPLSSATQKFGKLGADHLQQSIRATVASAKKIKDVASGFARAYDRTLLSLAAGMPVGRPPISATNPTILQVTRIPYVPFITLIVFDLVYAVLGTDLTVAALMALRMAFVVRDAQARLSTLAVVAEGCESPMWVDDAKNVDMLFAGVRGDSPRRIALTRRKDGRRFKHIMMSQNRVRGQVS